MKMPSSELLDIEIPNDNEPIPKKKKKLWLSKNVAIPLKTAQRYSKKGFIQPENEPLLMSFKAHDSDSLQDYARTEYVLHRDNPSRTSRIHKLDFLRNFQSENTFNYEIRVAVDELSEESISSDEFNCDSDTEVDVPQPYLIIESDYEELESDNDSEAEEEIIEVAKYEVALHQGSLVFLERAVFLIAQYFIKFKLSKNCLQQLLKIFNALLPEGNKLPNSNYKFFKYLLDFPSTSDEVRHYYCRNCLFYGGTQTMKKFYCNSCKTNSEYGFFIQFDISQQIKFLFEHRNLAKILQKTSSRNSQTICDITDGSEYIRANKAFEYKSEFDLTLILNTDGISYSKSSKACLWPVMFTIAEIPEHLRQSFVIVTSIWYDKMKPNMNTFLEPLCLRIVDCFNKGIVWVCPEKKIEIKSRIIAPFIIADAPARAEIQNISYFNGRYGCNMCEIKMIQSAPYEGSKRVRIYPFLENSPRLRTHARMLKQGKKASIANQLSHVKGVKGCSIITVIPSLDLSTCVAPECMYSLLLGIVKQFMLAWFIDNEIWTMKKFVSEIDTSLLSIKPPNIIKRMPRSVLLCKMMKAYEFLIWLLCYSLPIMEKYLDNEKFQHWILLVKATSLLTQKEISQGDLKEADSLLKLFVRDISNLYSDRMLTYNMHQLLHLSLFVSRWGPLWATSAFPFESYNGFLAYILHGTKNVSQELVNSIKIYEGFLVLDNKVNGMNKYTQHKESIKVVSQPTGSLSDIDEQRLRHENFDISNLLIYAKMKINCIIYTSQIYKELKTNTYTVVLQLERRKNIYGFIKFFFVYESKTYIYLNPLKILHDKMIYHTATAVKLTHILPCKGEDIPIIIDMENVHHIDPLFQVGNYICKTPHFLRKHL